MPLDAGLEFADAPLAGMCAEVRVVLSDDPLHGMEGQQSTGESDNRRCDKGPRGTHSVWLIISTGQQNRVASECCDFGPTMFLSSDTLLCPYASMMCRRTRSTWWTCA